MSKTKHRTRPIRVDESDYQKLLDYKEEMYGTDRVPFAVVVHELINEYETEQ